MTDQLNTAHAQTEALMSLLAVRALEDYAGAAQPTPTLEAPITGGGGTLTATEAALQRIEHAATYNKVLNTFNRVVQILTDLHRQITPTRTGKRCHTPGCEGDGLTNWHGRCNDCGPWIRANPGFTPNQIHSVDPEGNPIPGRTLVDDWNDRRPRECACTTQCCPDGCLDLIPPGVRHRTSDRCYKRQQRIREAS